MTEPYDPDAAQQAARDQLAEQAQAVTGNPAAAGIYGDPAGASQPSQPLDVNQLQAQRTAAGVAGDQPLGGAAGNLSPEAIAQLIEQLKAAGVPVAEPPAPPPPPPLLHEFAALAGLPAGVHSLARLVENRLAALEDRVFGSDVTT